MQPSYETYQSRSRAKLTATILTVVVIAGVVLMVDHLKSERIEAAASHQAPTTSQVAVTPAPAPASPSTPAATAPAASPPVTHSGTYTATSRYYVPNGSQSIKVNLTVQNGIITASSITNSESDPTSASYQQDFASAYKSYVIGKKISGLRLGVIAGASDTSKGFESALNQIASQV